VAGIEGCNRVWEIVIDTSAYATEGSLPPITSEIVLGIEALYLAAQKNY
jgi:hypothetical protein